MEYRSGRLSIVPVASRTAARPLLVEQDVVLLADVGVSAAWKNPRSKSAALSTSSEYCKPVNVLGALLVIAVCTSLEFSSFEDAAV